ncbi:MAG: bifunctional folylpolyglutamate synthase/dihydrofolate synthase [Verrucomicrobiota bacterium]|nr:bifunctional folylpolyglutamate synthase/dihydrofolate synthase [Verrucomicrobiota bacterium]
MNYREALAWLFGTQLFGIKLGLENIERLLRALELPAPNERIIHVAGTNGKGSVCAMTAAITRAGGYRTGLFTSPHLVTFRERIQVDGAMIPETKVARGLTSIRDLIGGWEPHPTFFEIATALSLLHFREANCEIVVLETGMGGRLDATNATTPVVSVITPINYDHQKWLGETLAEIAGEKAGIIKPRIPAVSAQQLPEATAVLREKARELSAPLEFVRETFGKVALAGAHQQQNAALAVAALAAAKIPVSERAISAGLTNVNWPARFQRWDERTVIDGAHNPAGARTLAQTWRETFGDEKATIIIGIFADKDAAEIYRELAPIAARAILTNFRGGRIMPAVELAAIITSITPTMPHALAASPPEALRMARENAERILIAGSLHLAGEMLAFLQGTPAAFEECAQ